MYSNNHFERFSEVGTNFTKTKPSYFFLAKKFQEKLNEFTIFSAALAVKVFLSLPPIL